MVDRHRIQEAERAIRPYIRRTPVVALEDRVTLKLELMQHAGSFLGNSGPCGGAEGQGS